MREWKTILAVKTEIQPMLRTLSYMALVHPSPSAYPHLASLTENRMPRALIPALSPLHRRCTSAEVTSFRTALCPRIAASLSGPEPQLAQGRH